MIKVCEHGFQFSLSNNFDLLFTTAIRCLSFNFRWLNASLPSGHKCTINARLVCKCWLTCRWCDDFKTCFKANWSIFVWCLHACICAFPNDVVHKQTLFIHYSFSPSLRHSQAVPALMFAYHSLVSYEMWYPWPQYQVNHCQMICQWLNHHVLMSIQL